VWWIEQAVNTHTVNFLTSDSTLLHTEKESVEKLKQKQTVSKPKTIDLWVGQTSLTITALMLWLHAK